MSIANTMQVGGAHYQGGAMQHWDFVYEAGLGYHAGNASKYADRFDRKNGAQDLEKGIHYCMKCAELGVVPPDEAKARAAVERYFDTNDRMPEQRLVFILLCRGKYEEAAAELKLLLQRLYTV